MRIPGSIANARRTTQTATRAGAIPGIRQAPAVAQPVAPVHPDQERLFVPPDATPTAQGPPSIAGAFPAAAAPGAAAAVPISVNDLVAMRDDPTMMSSAAPASMAPAGTAPVDPRNTRLDAAGFTGAGPVAPRTEGIIEDAVETAMGADPVQDPVAEALPQEKPLPPQDAARLAELKEQSEAAMYDPSHPSTWVEKAVTVVGEVISDYRKRLAKRGEKPMTDTRAPASKGRQRKEVEAKIKILDGGSAISATLTGDSEIPTTEVSAPALWLWRAWMHETSYLRTLLAQDPSIDQQLMLEEKYGTEAIVKFFEDNIVYVLAEKAPAVNEQSAHMRRVRAHLGPDVKVNPLVVVVWNADFDGDTMKLSFTPEAVRWGKPAANWLVSTAGEALIDVDFFNLALWDQVSAKTYLKMMFQGETFGELFPEGFQFTSFELTGLVDAIEKVGQGDQKAFRSLLRWTKEIADRTTESDADAELVISGFLESIYALNREIVMKRLEFQGLADFEGLPSIIDDMFESKVIAGEVPFPQLTSDPGMFSNLEDASVSSGGPFGFVEDRNVQFRWAAGIAKMAREMAELFGDEGGARIAEHIVATQMSGIAELDQKNIAVAQAARKMVFESLGGAPTFDSTADPSVWLHNDFRKDWNRAAFVVRSAAVSLGLDMSLKSGIDLWMPFIEAGDTPQTRDTIRKQFNAVFGDLTMERLFGNAAPVGWKNLPLSEFVHRNRLPKSQKFDEDTKFDTTEKFIGRLADIKTGFAHKFHNLIVGQAGKHQVTGVLSKFFDKDGKNILAELAIRRKTEGIVLDQDIQTLTQAFYALGEDAFYYFGLDNPERFLASKIGQKFALAKNEQELGSVLITLMSMYRFSVVFDLEASIKTEKSAAKKLRLLDQRHYELKKLRSSSDLWATLVDLYTAGDMSIFNGVLFSDETMNIKLGQMTKLVRAKFDSEYAFWEVFSELYSAPRDTFTGNRFLSDMGRKSLKSYVTAANSKLDSYQRENHDIYVAQVAKAKKDHYEDLVPFFGILKDEPHSLVDVALWSIADAALGILVKTYDSGEKGSQEAVTNYLFSLTGEVINGDQVPDLTYATDVALGGISMHDFNRSPIWLIKALSDPDFEVWVYTGKGRVRVDMEKLLGTRTPENADYWQFFELNPRVAMSLKMRTRQNEVDSKDQSYLITTESLSSSIGRVLASVDSDNERIVRRLMDYPGWHALLPLTLELEGRSVLQLRRPLTENITKVVDLLRSIGTYGDKLDYVRQMYEATPMIYYDDVYTWEALMELHKEGSRATAVGESISEASSADVRDEFGFQLAQVLIELAQGLDKYSKIVLGMPKIEPMKTVTPTEASQLFMLHDTSTIRSQQNIIQTHGAAKTSQSTTLQGGRTRAMWALQFLNYIRPETCTAPWVEDGIPGTDFIKNDAWTKYEGLKAYFPPIDEGGQPEWLVINETNLGEIMWRSGDSILVEDPAMCISPTCACPRHATEDKSTNTTTRNTPALGRVLLIVRMMASEALNLKVKTKGRDGKDSIAKMNVIAGLRNMQRELDGIYADEGMPAARLALAERLAESFTDVGYKDEFSIHDFVNVAQLLIREAGEDTPQAGTIAVMQLGWLNDIIRNDLVEARNIGKLEHSDAVSIVMQALNSPSLWNELDIETVLAGQKAYSQSESYDSRLPYNRSTSIGRNAAVVREIVENNNVEVYTDKEADAREDHLRAHNIKVFNRWEAIAGKKPEKLKDRDSYRIVGIIGADGKDAPTAPRPVDSENPRMLERAEAAEEAPGRLRAVGMSNAWVLDARAPNARAIITEAYKLGINLLIEGEIPANQWPEGIPELGDWQYISPEGLASDQFIMPMFEIHLNGGNTTWRGGTTHVGEFHSAPSKIGLIAETIGFDLGEALFQPTKSFAKHINFKRRAEYTLSLKQAFNTVVTDAESDSSGVLLEKLDRAPVTVATVADIRQIKKLSEQFDENGVSLLKLDQGVTIDPGTPAAAEFARAWDRYLGRLTEVNTETGLLPSSMPGEIVGFLKMAHPDGDVYHPIRIFEKFKEMGAPARVVIEESAKYHKESSTLVLPWMFQGDMDGRTFKIFEWLSGSNKTMARADAIDDIELKHGLKLAGYIARQSTAGRRLTMRRSQKMMTLFFLARMEPFGYNLAEHADTLPKNAELKELMLTADATIHHWMMALSEGDIVFFDSQQNSKSKTLNQFCNRIARRAVEYGINPTNVFASRFTRNGVEGVPSNIWFNFQVLWGDMKGETAQSNLMSLFHELMPRFVPDGVRGEQQNTLFNHDMQMLIPLEYKDRKGRKKKAEQWVDIYAGFHHFDEHFTGYSGSGTTVSPYSMSTRSTLMGAGNEQLSSSEIDRFMGWAADLPADVPMFTYSDHFDGRN